MDRKNKKIRNTLIAGGLIALMALGYAKCIDVIVGEPVAKDPKVQAEMAKIKEYTDNIDTNKLYNDLKNAPTPTYQ